jgi:hypothetical protein
MITTLKDEAFAYYHEMKNRFGRTHQHFSFSPENPWSSYMSRHLNQCEWTCKALALADQAMKDKP